MAGYVVTPVLQDAFSRIEVSAIDEVALAQEFPTFFQGMFGETAGGKTILEADASVFGMDIMRAGARKLASMVPRNMIFQTLGSIESKQMGIKHTRYERKFPLAEEVGVITTDMLQTKVPFEGSANYTTQQRARYHAHMIIQEQFARYGRLFEYLSAQSILEGTMPSVIGNTDTDTVYNWRRLSSHSVNKTSAKWTTAGTDILAQMDTAYELIEDDSHMQADYCLCAQNVPAGFYVNTDLLAFADIRRYWNVQVNGPLDVPAKLQWLVDGGAIPFAKVTTMKQREIYCFTLQTNYDNSGGTKTYYLPDGYVLMGSSSAKGHRLFGPTELGFELEADKKAASEIFGIDTAAPSSTVNINLSRPFVPEAIQLRAIRSPDTKRVDIISQAAPVFMPLNPNAFVKYYNCA